VRDDSAGKLAPPSVGSNDKNFVHKKTLPSRQRFSFINPLFFFLSFHHIPQRIQLRFAEQASGVALDHHPARITFCDLTRSIGLEPVRQDLERFAVYRQGMQRALAHHIHFGVHFCALSWFVSGLTLSKVYDRTTKFSPSLHYTVTDTRAMPRYANSRQADTKKPAVLKDCGLAVKLGTKTFARMNSQSTQAVTTALTLCAALAVVG
jgi:hypothetical protein